MEPIQVNKKSVASLADFGIGDKAISEENMNTIASLSHEEIKEYQAKLLQTIPARALKKLQAISPKPL